MELHTIGILSPGDMGHAIGRVLHQRGLRVLTSVQGRSARTAALAAEASITAVEDDETLVREAQIVLSILPPSQASALAERVALALKQTGTSLLFADCNAVAPRTVQAIEQVITGAGASFVDVGIIGSPPRPGERGPRLYASGPGQHRSSRRCRPLVWMCGSSVKRPARLPVSRCAMPRSLKG